MVDIYADPGLSGKNTKRVQFKRMIKDCEDGKIDLIITKSVSRFARNTLDCVQTARKLKADGIGIIFEKENLDTLQERSEFVLTIMASLAEEESRSISNNIRWSVKKKFQEGKEYEQQSQQVGMKIDQLLMRKEEILSEQGKVQLASYRIEEVTKLLQTGKILEEFDRVMFKSLVRKITVLSNKEIEIEFECGITVRETL